MRPTNGEISLTPASAQATAWGKEKSSVKLQLIDSFRSCSAALMPSQVEAILINTRSRGIPRCSYNAINWRPFLIEPSRSKERRAAVSADHGPGPVLELFVRQKTR